MADTKMAPDFAARFQLFQHPQHQFNLCTPEEQLRATDVDQRFAWINLFCRLVPGAHIRSRFVKVTGVSRSMRLSRVVAT